MDDEIPTKILKISTPYSLSPLTYICNKVPSTVVFPDILKYWEIKPLSKKGDKKVFLTTGPFPYLPPLKTH